MLNGILIGSDTVDSKLFSRSTGLYRLATLLRDAGNNIDVLDFFNYWNNQDLDKYYSKFISKYNHVDFIAISFSFVRLNFDNLLYLINKVRENNPTCRVIAGGYGVLGPQSSFEVLHEDDPVNLYFKGFIEGAINDIVDYLGTGKINPFIIENIKINNCTKKVIDCNVHYLQYDLERLATKYHSDDFISSNEAVVIETCRGCMFKCKFCTYELIGKKKTDNYIRTKEGLRQEIIENYNKWGTTKYIISDDTFNENPNKIDILYEISQEVDFKVTYWCLSRIDLIKNRPESIKKMIAAGINSYFFGIETLKERSARAIGKGFSGDRLKEYLLKFRNDYPDIDIGAGLICGLPYESYLEFENNLHWCLDNNIFNTITLNALFIPRTSNMTETSTLSSEFEKYGYSEMLLDDIKNMVDNRLEQLEYKPLSWVDTDNYVKKFLPWKNEHMNFLESSLYVENLNKMVREKNKNEAGLFCYLNSFDNPKIIYEKQFSTRTMLKIHRFISNYKKQKLLIN